MKETIINDFPVDLEGYLRKVLYNEELNTWLYKQINYKSRECLEQRETDQEIYRKVKLIPDREVPASIKKVMGGKHLEYIEETTYYKDKQRMTISNTPNILNKKFFFKGELKLVPIGDNSIRREFEMEVKVKIFGLGTIIEKFLFEQIKKGYAKGADLTIQYLNGELQID